MKAWFQSLPVHRKLIVIALAVSAAALVTTIVGLVVFDIARFRTAAVDDTLGAAQVIAENTAAALVFNDPDAARQTLASVHVRPMVSRACVYRLDGSVLASYERSPGDRCPATPQATVGWRAVAERVPVTRNGRVVGSVYIERVLSDLRNRVMATAAAGVVMLMLAGLLALALARRLQRLISEPIVSLSGAAERISRNEAVDLDSIPAPPDETGALVRAFRDMVRQLLSTNDALRVEIEERRRMQRDREELLAREREASRLKDEFLAAVSHELRTPLNAILGWTHILSTTKPSEEVVAKAIASLNRNAQAQSRVIEDLLDVSRIITGKLQLSLKVVDLRGVVESAREVVAPIAAAKHIEFAASVPSLPCIVQADRDRIQQVLWNLLSNAVKFTPPRGAVSIRLEEDGDRYAVSVTDTGIGIAPAFLPHAFERFRQADGSSTREHGGLGLGLAIVKELTELHGGFVSVASEGPNKGATFRVTLPRLMGAPTTAAALGADMPDLPRLDGIDVLVVDDNPDALDIATIALSEAGAAVRVAASGGEALEQFNERLPHVVICDIAMPQMDGFAVLTGIRNIDRSYGRVTPVLALSAYASAEDRARSLRAGFHEHLVKPCSRTNLIAAIADAVARV